MGTMMGTIEGTELIELAELLLKARNPAKANQRAHKKILGRKRGYRGGSGRSLSSLACAWTLEDACLVY